VKVALVTPMRPESAIADVMVQAVPRLSEDCDIEIWCPTAPEYRACPVPVIPYLEADADTLSALAAYDLVIYVLGNSPHHSQILPLARALPGLVVLHDVAMTDMVRHSASVRDVLDVVARRVADDSTPEDAEIFRRGLHPDGTSGWMRFSEQVPMSDYAIETSLGAVVHSWWHAGLVDGRTLGDVTVAPLPVPSPRVGFNADQLDDAAGKLDGLTDDAVLVVTVGSANANRRIDAMLDAIASDPVLASRVHLWSVGPTQAVYAGELRALASSLGLSDRFAVVGAVSDALLHDILDRADIAAALRDPVLEGQSASVFTQMLAGIPLVVLDHAHYAELPDAVAVRADPQDVVNSVRAAFRWLVDHPRERDQMGTRGRDFVLSTRSGAAYGEAILEGVRRAIASRPLVQATIDVAERLRLTGLNGHRVVTTLVADLAFELFDLE
jgi:glycosyltransferase involved in cell wall biosynthesis